MEHWEIVNGRRNTIDTTAQGLWGLAVSYFEWCKENPKILKKTITSGKKAGDKVDEEVERPYTIKGLCFHCGITEEYLHDLKNLKDKSSEYYIVITQIINLIHTQNVEGAMINQFNAMFTAKVLNMDTEERINTPVQISIIQGLPSLSNSENEIIEKLELEKEILKNTKEQNL